METSSQPIVAIYHQDCVDGTTAAAVVLKKFPTARLFPLKHGYTPADFAHILEAVGPSTLIFTVDCGSGAQELLATGHQVTTIDHHAGAKELFEQLAAEYSTYSYIFDNDKSGTSLAWSYFFPTELEPEIVSLVEDRDLWKWQFGERTAASHEYLSLLVNQPEKILVLFDLPLATIEQEGALMTKYKNFQVEAFCAAATPIYLLINTASVPFYNTSFFQSEIGNNLSTLTDRAVCLFSLSGDEVKLSFRSLATHQPSALDLAKQLGGNGHQNAAGARISLDQFLRLRAETKEN